MKKEKKTVRILPGWLFVITIVVYNEVMLHLWTNEEFHTGRLATVVLFAIGFGAMYGLITSLIPSPKWEKAAAVAVGLLVTVFWVTESFIVDAYQGQGFMTPATIIGGAGGVATDFFGPVVSVVSQSLGQIAMMLLPIVVYCVFFRTESPGWKTRTALVILAAAMGAAGFATAKNVDGIGQFTTSYNFDSAVRSLGLNTALVLDSINGSAQEKEPEFIVPEEIPTEPAAPAETQDVQQTQPEAVVYGDQVIEGVDFAQLAQQGGGMSGVYSYLASQTPAKKNGFTGLFAGKNLILITAEAFAAEVIDPELTPTLYRLANKGIKFTDYYQPAWGASTTSGEYSNLMGIMPTTGGACMQEANQQKMFLTMGYQLSGLGYKSLCYHNHIASFYSRERTHMNLGYEDFIAIGTGLEDITSEWPESDREMFELTMDDYIGNQPFNVYYMTVSAHCPYNHKENAQSKRHYDKVADLKDMYGQEHSETVKNYVASNLELEAGLTSLVNRLEAEGIADDTVIVLATDHYPYGLERSKTWKNTVDHLAELYGLERYDNFQRDHNALIIWSGSIEDMGLQVDEPVFSLDILPTLSNLFGVEYDSRLLVGRDVFSDQEPVIFWPNYSWKTDKGTYDRRAGTFTPVEGVTVDEGYVERIDAVVANRITYSRSVNDKNFFGALAKAIGK